MSDRPTERVASILFATSLALSAALLFSVEPLVGKMITPLLGGAPAVWLTCMLFFQTVLLVGYAYAHASTTWLHPRTQLVLHVVALAIPFIGGRIRIDESALLSFAKNSPPAWQVLRLVAVSVGLPFFALSTSAPVLQRWFALAGGKGAKDPYFLYAASNFGSLLALAAYPLLIEPALGLGAQSSAWQVGYGLFFAASLACAVISWRGAPEAARAARDDDERDAGAAQIGWRRRIVWLALAFAPSSALMGLTQFVTAEIAPVPLLWVLPLFLYLATFVVAFSKTPVLSVARASRIFPLAVTMCAIALDIALNRPAPLVVGLHLIVFFLGAMICHGRLAADRPAPRHLTEFFLCLSIGGVLGGLFNVVVAPAIFHQLYEYPLALVFMTLARPRAKTDVPRVGALDFVMPLIVAALIGAVFLAYTRLHLSPTELVVLVLAPAIVNYRAVARPLRFGLGVAALLSPWMLDEANADRLLFSERNFFGVLRVTKDPTGRFMQLAHGSTIHGKQSLAQEDRREPLTYFDRSGPLGDVFEAIHAQPEPTTRDVAIVGLGAGAIACYARPGERWTFYEIDPAVVRVARDPAYFTFLSDSFPDPSHLNVVVGDARLMIGHAATGAYGLIVLDAFSGDTIPMHLITLEAMRVYADKLADDGMLAFNLSNRYVDLRPELEALARESGFAASGRDDLHSPPPELAKRGKLPSRWVAMARTERPIAKLRAAGWERLPGRDAKVWTDDRSNLMGAFMR